MEYIFVVAGLAFLFFGGDWLVEGAVALSVKLGLPAFLISLTVVGFGTSLPELLVSVRAALSGAPGIALGNVVGSNIANILLILGVAALVYPLSPPAGKSTRDLWVMLLSSAGVVALMATGTIGFAPGLVMVVALVTYLVVAYFQDRHTETGDLDAGAIGASGLKIGVLLIGGLALLAAGAEMLVRGATVIASDLGISNAVIGLTVVAVGTSLPELATSVTAALKRQSDIAIGNVIGSNIFNILGILGITAMIAEVPVADRFIAIDGWALLAATAALFLPLLFGRGISRLGGAALVVAYAGYMVTMA
ncbi:sodium:calcium antiporter [Rhizobiaceae bacterium]|nr:sodium:calcium antiporter [Rhizobiaceae bacterium]